MFKMNEEKPMVDQVYKFQMIAYEVCNEGIQVYEQICKLHPSSINCLNFEKTLLKI